MLNTEYKLCMRCILQVMQHGEFINRIRKTLYYGGVDTTEADMEVSMPFAEYAADLFSEPHRGHSLHRLSSIAAGKTHATPCSLIMALIYLDRLNIIDPGYGYRITPQELFVVSLVSLTRCCWLRNLLIDNPYAFNTITHTHRHAHTLMCEYGLCVFLCVQESSKLSENATQRSA